MNDAGSWAEHAACIGREMFVESQPRPGAKFLPRPTREIVAGIVAETCDVCPVMPECRQWAMQRHDPAYLGIAGGLSYFERQQRRKRIRKVAA